MLQRSEIKDKLGSHIKSIPRSVPKQYWDPGTLKRIKIRNESIKYDKLMNIWEWMREKYHFYNFLNKKTNKKWYQ